MKSACFVNHFFKFEDPCVPGTDLANKIGVLLEKVRVCSAKLCNSCGPFINRFTKFFNDLDIIVSSLRKLVMFFLQVEIGDIHKLLFTLQRLQSFCEIFNLSR